MRPALLIIDVQMDYFPGGRMELVGAAAAAEALSALLKDFRRLALPVFHVQHVATKAGATFFLPGTPGVEIHPRLAPVAGEGLVVKHFPSSFRDTGLDALLRSKGVDTLVVAGMMTHMCVDTTVRAAFDLGYSLVVAGDACATKKLAFGGLTVEAGQVQASYLAALDGTFARVSDAAGITGILQASPA
jgi:nicotinamidase-related amidase